MTLEKQIILRKLQFVFALDNIAEKIATFFNYPEVIGMDKTPPMNDAQRAVASHINNLPMHVSRVPPPPDPRRFVDVIWGNPPQAGRIMRTFFEHKKHGFYNFYALDYKNIWVLPDPVSRWIQINMDITVDTTRLDAAIQAVFVALVLFYFLLEFRVKLYWFLTINPYTRPWVYLIACTDWINDLVAGMAPVFFGIDLSASLVMLFVGKIADSLNHLILTMPYLPTEAIYGQTVHINRKDVYVMMFVGLPKLWKEEPIPNHLREFWFNKRPEILKFMKAKYGNLDIDFEPDRVLKNIYDSEHHIKPILNSMMKHNEMSTNIICDISSSSHHAFDFIFSNSDHFFSVLTNSNIV